MIKNSFERDYLLGKRGENIFLEIMENSPLIKKIYPSSLKEQKEGVDGFFIDNKGNNYSYDLKTLTKTYNNICLEYISNPINNIKGWFLTSQADFIFYLYLDTLIIRTLHLKNMRNWMKKNIHKYSLKESKPTLNKEGKECYKTLCCYPPLKDIPKECLHNQLNFIFFKKNPTNSILDFIQ